MILKKIVWFILTANFINLTVNFSENGRVLKDPIDTLTELIYEYGLGGDADDIPDNGTEQEDQNLKTSKYLIPSIFNTFKRELVGLSTSSSSYLNFFIAEIFGSQTNPPPDFN